MYACLLPRGNSCVPTLLPPSISQRTGAKQDTTEISNAMLLCGYLARSYTKQPQQPEQPRQLEQPEQQPHEQPQQPETIGASSTSSSSDPTHAQEQEPLSMSIELLPIPPPSPTTVCSITLSSVFSSASENRSCSHNCTIVTSSKPTCCASTIASPRRSLSSHRAYYRSMRRRSDT